MADVASADGKTKGGATFYAEYGNVDATVSGVAGSIVGYSGGASRTVENTFVAVPPAGKTTVTNEFNSAYEAGSVKISTTSKDRKSVVLGKSVLGRGTLGGGRLIKKKKKTN